MTIKVKVTNEDTRPTAVVRAVCVNPDGSPQAGATAHELKAGDSAELWVHSGSKVEVQEVSQ